MGAAARVGDLHTCPLSEGTIAHEGGPILQGTNYSVLIGGLPAAVVGDTCSCNGPPDILLRGSASVFIAGKPACRIGDRTAHGGEITEGCGSVLIGD